MRFSNREYGSQTSRFGMTTVSLLLIIPSESLSAMLIVPIRSTADYRD